MILTVKGAMAPLTVPSQTQQLGHRASSNPVLSQKKVAH